MPKTREIFIYGNESLLFSHFKNIVELHSVFLALTCSCALILVSSGIKFISNGQRHLAC